MKRLQFDFSEKRVKSLAKLAKATEATSNAEVVRRALKVNEFIIDKSLSGFEVALVKDDERIIIPPIAFGL